MNFSKKLIAGVTSAFLMLGTAVAPIGESGAFGSVLLTSNAETYSDYEYQVLDDGTVEITDYHGEYFDEPIVIPATIDGKKVTSIGDYAFSEYTSLESITIPSGVTSIGDSAFEWCDSLSSINIPNSVTSIGSRAFCFCTSLENITIPESVTYIGGFAFGDTEWLKNKMTNNLLVIINNILIDGRGCSGDVIIPDSVTEIGDNAFWDCKSIDSIIVPNSVASIGNSAFSYCTNLKSITIPDSVTNISDQVFCGCTSLESITIPNGVTSVGYDAFRGCTSLDSITIPDTITCFGGYAFEKTKWLENKRIDDPLVIVNGILIDGHACSGDIIIPNYVTSICDYAFFDNDNLTSVTIPKSVLYIGDSAFSALITNFPIYGYRNTAAERCIKNHDLNFIPLDDTETSVTLDINLNANDKTMSSENVNISINGEEASTSDNGKAELSLADGTHEITFSAHGFVPRTYTVEVKDGQLSEELTPELNLIGDADGNGVVNTLDIVKLKRHLIKVEPLTGYALDCANTDGNDTVNTLDIVKLKRHLINVEKLW